MEDATTVDAMVAEEAEYEAEAEAEIGAEAEAEAAAPEAAMPGAVGGPTDAATAPDTPTDPAADVLQLEALLLARAYLFTLFHKAFGGEPDEALLSALESQAAIDAAEEYAADNETLAGLARFLRELAERDQAELADAAHDEYTRIFVGPAILPASPYESPYRTNDPSTFQENTLVVRELYRAAGWKARKIQRVPDDHVALLMQFGAIGAREALQAFRAGEWKAAAEALRAQHAFVQGHLANWLPEYAVALRKQETAVLYPQLVEAAAAFAQADAVFTAEAAYYLQQAAAPVAPAPGTFAAMDAALADLASLRLRFLEDNELVAVGA